MVKMAPSILSADFSRLREQIELLDKLDADWIHLDVMDGHFVPNITFGPIVAQAVRKISDRFLDAHLMVDNADDFLKDFADAGVNQLTVHVEACPHLWDTIKKIQKLGINAGVTLNPATPIQSIEPVLGLVQNVLVMTVEPGYGGQAFIPEMLNKIRWLHEKKLALNLDYEIEVDGGIDENTAPQVVTAGATVLVSGSSILGQKDIPAAYEKIKSAANLATAQIV